MPGASNLTTRNGVFYFRARVPKSLVEAYGRSMVSVSLETSHATEARQRAHGKRLQLDAEFERLGQGTRLPDTYTGTVLHLSDADIEQICYRFRAEALAADEAERIEGKDSFMGALDGDIEEAHVSALRKNYSLGRLEDVYPDLQRFLKSIELRVPSNTPSYERLCRRFQTAQIEVHQAVMQRRRGDVVDVPQRASGAITFADVFSRWKSDVTDRPLKTVRAFEQAFELFRATCLAANASMVTFDDALSFSERLVSEGGMSRKNVVKLLTFLRAAFQVSVNARKLPSNPFHGVKVRVSEEEIHRDKRIPFTLTELNTILAGRVYQPGYEPRLSLGADSRWLFLLALFTGARLEELAQLHAEDVQEDPDHGWFLRLHTEGERQLKNVSSWRRVPVHPELKKLGFLEYIKGIKVGRAFPALRADKYGKLGTSFSTWFGLEMDKVHITDPLKVFHSTRHSFIEVCKQKVMAIPEEVRDAICGHLSKKDIERRYGHVMYPLEPMVAAMKLVEFKGLQISHLYKS